MHVGRLTKKKFYITVVQKNFIRMSEDCQERNSTYNNEDGMNNERKFFTHNEALLWNNVLHTRNMSSNEINFHPCNSYQEITSTPQSSQRKGGPQRLHWMVWWGFTRDWSLAFTVALIWVFLGDLVSFVM